MKKLSTICTLIIFSTFSIKAAAQEMPAGIIAWTIHCSLTDGTTVAEAVEWARSRPRDETAPNRTVFRQPVIGPPNFEDNYDLRVLTYYANYNQYVSRTQMMQPSPAVQRANQQRAKYMTCDPDTRRIDRVRNVPGSGGYQAQGTTMVHGRLCTLEEGATVADAWRSIVAISNNYRQAGDNSLMQMSVRHYGPVQNRTGTNVLIRAINSPAGMANRIDMGINGFQALQGVDTSWSCNYPVLWRTHVINVREDD